MLKSKWVRPEETLDRKGKLIALENDTRLRHIPPTNLEILLNRGYETAEDILSLLDMDPTNVHNPKLLLDADKVVSVLMEAVEKQYHIVVYGDYDADGASATSVAVLALRKLGAKVDYFINNRFKHGYGIMPSGVDDLLVKFPTAQIILTVDNGIVAYDGIDYANSKGLKVLVTDHHDPSPDNKMPNALAVVNPKRVDCPYPFKGLCGASVIFKIMQYLYFEMDVDGEYVDELIDIVGMATIGDVMPLVDENRVFVLEALRRLENNSRKAFEILRKETKVSEINEEVFGFKYVPMVNAPSRMDGSIDLAVDLFLETDEDVITSIVKELIEINERRKTLTAEQETIAMDMLEKKGVKSVVVLYHEDFHEGIVGLIAGRIKEKYNRPTIVLTKHGNIAKGSGRSIEGFHITQGLHSTSETLIGFGGHSQACGMSLNVDKVDELEARMIERADALLTEDDFVRKIMIDAVVTPSDLTVDFIDDLNAMRPFGAGFPKPVLGLKDFYGYGNKALGSEGKHIKILSKQLEILMFNGGDYYKSIGRPTRVKALGYPSLNVWNGKVTVQFNIDGENIVAV